MAFLMHKTPPKLETSTYYPLARKRGVAGIFIPIQNVIEHSICLILKNNLYKNIFFVTFVIANG